LLSSVQRQASAWECRRIYLTSESENTAARALWPTIGFVNAPGDRIEHGVSLISDFKGPGKHRAVYELLLTEH
jgi:hypothetical protein